MVRLNRIYTRTGDDGSTGLVDGSRVAKDSALIAAIGDVDEANSALGLAIALLAVDAPEMAPLRRVQNDLFDLGADIATPADAFADPSMALRITPEQVAWLESEMDRMTALLPPLTSFVLPGGNASVGALHLARATARRAERSLVAAAREQAISDEALRYINRLSDFLFVFARMLAQADGEILWVPGASR